MTRRATAAAMAAVLGLAAVVAAEQGTSSAPAAAKTVTPDAPAAAKDPPASLWTRDTLTGNWFGYGDRLAEKGLTISLSATQVYHGVVHGGTATHRHAGRYAGSYDLELEAELDALAGLKGALVYAAVEGSWSEGLDASSVGSLFGVNDDAGGDRSADVSDFWYQQSLADDRVVVRIGKLDLTGTFECRGCPVSFDGNRYANDETLQFLNGALVNNPSIPFPDNGLGLMVYVEPVDGWYVSAGLADAQADARETGFNTAFHDEDYFFAIAETGLVGEFAGPRGPLTGAVRVGLWYDPQPKGRFDGRGADRDDIGAYLSADQLLLREGPDDDQGLGVFLRLGFADQDLNPVRFFWSTGAQYMGLLPGRDADVLGVGMARGRTTDEPGAGFTSPHETVLEAYYAVQVAPSRQNAVPSKRLTPPRPGIRLQSLAR